MKDSVSVEFLKAIGTAKSGAGTAKWMQARCPFAFWEHSHGDKTPSFGISRTAQWGQCFGCGFSGSLFELTHRLARLEAESPSGVLRDLPRAFGILVLEEESADLLAPAELPYDEAVLSPPADLSWPEDFLAPFEPAWHEDQVHPYLAKRGVSATTARRLDIRFDDYRGRICFPLRDGMGRLMGLHGRAINDETVPHYWFYTRNGKSNPQVWHNEHQADFTKPLIITESVFDMAAIYPVWANVITGRSAKMKPEMFERLVGCTQIITWFDGDKAGDMARKQVETSMACPVVHVVPDADQDAGSMGQQEIQARWNIIEKTGVFSLLF